MADRCVPETGGRTPKKLARRWVTESEPIAFGICGLTPAEFMKMTPAEFRAVANARITDRNEEYKLYDRQNAKLCNIIARGLGLQVENRTPEERDFMLMRDDREIDPAASQKKMKAGLMMWSNNIKNGGT